MKTFSTRLWYFALNCSVSFVLILGCVSYGKYSVRKEIAAVSTVKIEKHGDSYWLVFTMKDGTRKVIKGAEALICGAEEE